MLRHTPKTMPIVFSFSTQVSFSFVFCGHINLASSFSWCAVFEAIYIHLFFMRNDRSFEILLTNEKRSIAIRILVISRCSATQFSVSELLRFFYFSFGSSCYSIARHAPQFKLLLLRFLKRVYGDAFCIVPMCVCSIVRRVSSIFTLLHFMDRY